MSISTPPARTRSAAVPGQEYAHLKFEQTVPRSLVHRACVSEVFLTDGCRVDGERVYVAAQWPRSHALFQPDADGGSDPVLLVETVRQAAIYVAHRFHAVPLEHRFIFCDLDFGIEDLAALRVTDTPLSVVLDASFRPEANRSSKRLGARFDAVLHIGGRRCARASVRLLAVGEQLYSVLRHRGQAPEAPAPAPQGEPHPAAAPLLSAARVGQVRAENVLIGAGPAVGTYRLHLDPHHPGYFEHACDHVPGMALVEAFRQASYNVLLEERGHDPHVLMSSAVDFDAFGELDAPVSVVVEAIEAEDEGPRLVRLVAVQGTRTLARSTCRYERHGAVAGRAH
ncbi:ScbA/BarX family gamma-butyrolactone biosynthesis protein [Streptomyces sp. NPDC000410]|uniref:ScbA/BarX family gamma-butyrolactone biosynthesis protein n=1 Tax=Streptomyces sp. NPDC000410 TaxID=3154254 RepID=UPI00331E08F8